MKRGFSLAEALVASTLLLLVLTSLAVLVHSYSGSSRASDAHDASFSGCRLAVESIRKDGEAACKLLEPALGSNTAHPVLRLQRVDPEIQRLPDDFPSTPPATWDPYDATQMVEVRYYLVGDHLWREVFLGDGSQRKTLVGRHMQGFFVTSLADNTLRLQLVSLNVQGQNRPISGRVPLRCLDLRP